MTENDPHHTGPTATTRPPPPGRRSAGTGAGQRAGPDVDLRHRRVEDRRHRRPRDHRRARPRRRRGPRRRRPPRAHPRRCAPTTARASRSRWASARPPSTSTSSPSTASPSPTWPPASAERRHAVERMTGLQVTEVNIAVHDVLVESDEADGTPASPPGPVTSPAGGGLAEQAELVRTTAAGRPGRRRPARRGARRGRGLPARPPHQRRPAAGGQDRGPPRPPVGRPDVGDDRRGAHPRVRHRPRGRAPHRRGRRRPGADRAPRAT